MIGRIEMKQVLNRIIDQLSDFFAFRKGLLLILGLILVLANGILQFFPSIGWLVQSNLLLHVGLILAILGVLVAWAL